MKPYYETKLGKLYHGEHPYATKDIPDNTFDSIVTDPPYGLKFMGKKWDYNVPSVKIWQEFLRILKPGGFLLSFAGTRTQHRMACNIEDAGFEIRDMIGWLYGSGFPKSLNIGKAIDKIQGNEREIVGKKEGSYADIRRDKKTGQDSLHGGIAAKERPRVEVFETKGNSEFEGWGTALKPALEPITVARKPVEGTVAQNVLKYGTGGINIDRSRIALNGDYKCRANGRPSQTGLGDNYDPDKANQPDTQGRFPANIIHDGSDEVLNLFPIRSAGGSKTGNEPSEKTKDVWGKYDHQNIFQSFGDNGSAARFFYCAKASKKDRGKGNIWPTVKPTTLMQYLVNLVTPKGGILLDPFGGSGSTAKACEELGVRWVLFDMELKAIEITANRIEKETQQLKLFG